MMPRRMPRVLRTGRDIRIPRVDGAAEEEEGIIRNSFYNLRQYATYDAEIEDAPEPVPGQQRIPGGHRAPREEEAPPLERLIDHIIEHHIKTIDPRHVETGSWMINRPKELFKEQQRKEFAKILKNIFSRSKYEAGDVISKARFEIKSGNPLMANISFPIKKRDVIKRAGDPSGLIWDHTPDYDSINVGVKRRNEAADWRIFTVYPSMASPR